VRLAYEWDRSSLTSDAVHVSLSPAAVSEAEKAKSVLSAVDTRTATDLVECFPVLAGEIETLRRERIDGPPGFCIIDGMSSAGLDGEQRRGLFLLLTTSLGLLLPQNAAGDQIVEVFDRGAPLQAGGRYHQTNASGVVHSDSPQWPAVPDYVTLLCVRAARGGGESKFISGYSVLRRLEEVAPGAIDELRNDFLFDKRGDFAAGEPPVTAAPIFDWVGDELRFRYLRAYIDSGHRLMAIPLSDAQTRALDVLDSVLADGSLVVADAMAPGDMQVLNNHFVVHDRSPFEDFPEPERRRMMLRAWLQRDTAQR
jgi:hypothetical protein